MTTTTERQITSGKAESIETDATFNGLLADYRTGWAEGYQAIIAHIEAVREKDREEAYVLGCAEQAAKFAEHQPCLPEDADGECQSCDAGNCTTGLKCVTLGKDDPNSWNWQQRAEKAEAERDHWKAIAERQTAGLAKLQRYDFQGNAEYEAFRIASPEGEYIEFDDVAAILSPAQQEPAKDVWADGINPAHVAAYDTALKEC